MQLQKISYCKEFLNSLIEILNTRKTNCSEDELKDIEKHIFILEHRIISEYDKINIEIEDNISDAEDISINTSEFVKRILRLFSQIDGFLKNDHLAAYKDNVKLAFNGFDDHNDIEEYYGAVDYAEYLINYEERFVIFKDVFREGTSSDNRRYLEALKFFEKKDVSADSIIEFARQK